MRRYIAVIGSLMGLFLITNSSTTPTTAEARQEAVLAIPSSALKKAEERSVRITFRQGKNYETKAERSPNGIILETGFVLTCAHVPITDWACFVQDEECLKNKSPGFIGEKASIPYFIDSEHDIAILQVKTGEYPPLALEKNPQPSQKVFISSCGILRPRMLSTGIISGMSDHYVDYDLRCMKGMSGSGVYTWNGNEIRLVAIHTEGLGEDTQFCSGTCAVTIENLWQKVRKITKR